MTLWHWFDTHPRFFSVSGPAPGPGPRRSLALAVGDIFFSDKRHYWTALEDDGYFTPKILRPMSWGGNFFSESQNEEEEDVMVDEISDDAEQFFRAFGLYWRICLAWEVDCLKLSPMFALFILTMDLRVALSDSLLSTVAPNLAARLRSLPPTRRPSGQWNISSMEDPYLMVVSVMPHHEVRSRWRFLFSSILPDTIL